MARANVRLLPALMATIGVVMGLKAVAVAEEAADHGAGAAHEAPAPAAPSQAAAGSGGGEAAAKPATDSSVQCAPSFADQAGLSQTEVQVLQSLGERRRQLDARSAEIETKTELLSAAEKRVDARVAELKRIEANIEQLLGKLDEAEEARIAALVNVYQRMRPKDAAEIFNGLEDETLFAVASRMKQQNLAEVMGLMAAERARTLTRMMAARPASVAPTPSAKAG